MDELLKHKIKQLAHKMEQNTLFDNELSGYMKDSQRRAIFRQSSQHFVLEKKKHAYIDQWNGPRSEKGGSGKLMIQTEPDARKNRAVYPVGSVFSIKAYGQKNRYLGDVDKVSNDFERANQSLIKGIMERAKKNKEKRVF